MGVLQVCSNRITPIEDRETELDSEEVSIIHDMTPHHWVTGSRLFETAWWPRLQKSKRPQRQLRCLETPHTNYPLTRHQIPDVLPPHPHFCENLKIFAMGVITANLRLLNILLWKGNQNSHVTLNPDIKLYLNLANHSTSRETIQMKVVAEGGVTDNMSVPLRMTTWTAEHKMWQPMSSLPHVSSAFIPGERVPATTG